MPACFNQALLRQWVKRWPWILYGALLLAILVAGARMRYRIPQTPLFDGDSWGYLAPAFLKLSGGGFQHTFGRNFVYPAFLFVVLCLFGNYEAIALWQHALGLLTGVLLALAWNLLCELLAVSGRARMAARFLGLVVAADCLLTPSAVLFEQTIRPEAVFPLFLALSFALNFYALNPRHAVRRPALARWCLGVNLVVVCVAASLKPSTGFAIIAMNLPLVFWLMRGGDPWSEKVKVAGAALAVAAVAFWLPERQLARSDPTSTTFLPMTLFAIHAGIIHQQILDDLRTGHTAPYAPGWLAAFNRNLERVLGAASLPANHPWPTIGFNADYLMFRDSIFDPFFGQGKEREMAAFSSRYFWRTWFHRPGAMLGEVAANLAVVYDPRRAMGPSRPTRPPRLIKRSSGVRSWGLLPDLYGGALYCAQNPAVHARLVTSQYALGYLSRLDELTHTKRTIWQFPFIGPLNDWLKRLRTPLLVLALAAGIPLLSRTGAQTLAGAVWLCLLVDFSLFLTVAAVHSLDISRYVQNAHACSVFGEFAVLLLPGQWLCLKAKDQSVAADD